MLYIVEPSFGMIFSSFELLSEKTFALRLAMYLAMAERKERDAVVCSRCTESGSRVKRSKRGEEGR